jgi:pimeloyl-ACP methyl ester carboxylesterase
MERKQSMLEYQYLKGNGSETIVLLHGMGGNSNIFYKQINEYRKYFNILAIHLPGHGNSPDIDHYKKKFTYDLVIEEIRETMDHLSIKKAHFVGISLGSIITHHLLQKDPDCVISAVLGGTITRFNSFAKALLTTGNIIKGITPYMFVYALFAHIMMPKRNHKKSRKIFVREAKKMKRSNFLAWFTLIRNAELTYTHVHMTSKSIPKLYISGKEDHLFVKELTKDIEKDTNASILLLDQCGHVCNIEKPQEFNTASLTFIQEHSQALKETS